MDQKIDQQNWYSEKIWDKKHSFALTCSGTSRHLTPLRHLLETFLIYPRQLLDTVQTSPRHLRLRLQSKLYSMKKIEVVGGWTVLSGNNTTSWLHLAGWNLPDSQLSWESKMEPSVAISPAWLGLAELGTAQPQLVFLKPSTGTTVIATLGSILDSQLSWESGKF